MPYRHTARNSERPPDEMTAAARRDDLILGGLMLLLAVPRVILALATHETFGAESSIAAVAAGLGVLLLVTAHAVRRE